VIELDYGIVRPEAAANFLAQYHRAWRSEQHPEYLEGLLLKPNSKPILAQLGCPEIEYECAEPQIGCLRNSPSLRQIPHTIRSRV